MLPFYKRACLPISLLACLGQAGFAQCSHSTTLTEEQRELEDRSVLLTVKVKQGGSVRDATVIRGPESLRAPAIRAAKARKYKHRVVYSFPDAHETMVEVTFPRDGNGKPEVRQALPGGVSSCVYPQAVRISPQVMQSRLIQRVEPTFPTEAQQVEGTIVLRLRVDKEGNVYKAEKVSGPDVLAAPFIEAVKEWKYEPFLLNGDSVEVETTVEWKFP